MKVFVSLFGMVIGLGSMLLGGFGALYAHTFGDFVGFSMNEISLTFLAGFVILVASIYAYPAKSEEVEEDEEPQKVPEWPLEERHYQ